MLVYRSYSLLLTIFPISLSQTDVKLNLLAILFIFLIESYGNFSTDILLTFAQKIMMDIIPDENRNSYYSLMPKVTLLVSTILIVPVGNFLEQVENFGLTILIFIFIPVVLCSLTSYISTRNLTSEKK